MNEWMKTFIHFSANYYEWEQYWTIINACNESKTAPEVSWRRNWQRHNKELLLAELSKLNLDLTINNVQDHWNYLEQKLVTIADKIAPIVEYTNNETTESGKTPVHIKRKINGLINHDWMNLSLNSYKVKCKAIFLSWLSLIMKLNWNELFL